MLLSLLDISLSSLSGSSVVASSSSSDDPKKSSFRSSNSSLISCLTDCFNFSLSIMLVVFSLFFSSSDDAGVDTRSTDLVVEDATGHGGVVVS